MILCGSSSGTINSSSRASRAGPMTRNCSRPAYSCGTTFTALRKACSMSSSGTPHLRALSLISTREEYVYTNPRLSRKSLHANRRQVAAARRSFWQPRLSQLTTVCSANPTARGQPGLSHPRGGVLSSLKGLSRRRRWPHAGRWPALPWRSCARGGACDGRRLPRREPGWRW